MSKLWSFIRYWLPLLVWMVVIFSASGDSHSYQHSSRFIVPFLHWAFPHMPEDQVDRIHLFCRKCAHLSEYAILALLFWRAVRKPVWRDQRPWSWKLGFAAIVFVALYASTDEFHQRYVPTREASPVDVMIDTTGAAIGIGLFWAQGRLRKRW